jgi:DnaK suppressor protein
MDQGMKKLQIKQLQAEREHTLSKLARIYETLRSNIDPDSDDGASDLEEHDNAWALVPGLKRKLAAIEHALQRVRLGTYGLCERCGEAIDLARLEIVPEATFCMPCQMTVEQAARSRTKKTRP